MGWRYASVSSRDVYQVTPANARRSAGPATQPMVEIAHVRERMPDPITVVTTWAVAVRTVPASSAYSSEGLVGAITHLSKVLHYWQSSASRCCLPGLHVAASHNAKAVNDTYTPYCSNYASCSKHELLQKLDAQALANLSRNLAKDALPLTKVVVSRQTRHDFSSYLL